MSVNDDAYNSGSVFRIRDIDIKVNDEVISDIGSDGVTITPGGENTLIEGLLGKKGFAVDEDDSAEIKIPLLSRSASNVKFLALFTDKTVFSVVIDPIDDHAKAAVKFESITIPYCMIQKVPEDKMSKDAPIEEWTIIGYGYRKVPYT